MTNATRVWTVVTGLCVGGAFWVGGVPALSPDEQNTHPEKPAPRKNRAQGRFFRGGPIELQLGCVVTLNQYEETYAKQLEKGDPAEQLAAARSLWDGHSRRHASDVLKFLATPPPGGGAFRALQRKVDASLQPQAILRELREVDYRWGSWLAFLRPHKDLVPTLLAGLKNEPDLLPETILALGNSGDPRALQPLVDLLGSKDYVTAGYAAQALGYLGAPTVEPKLIEVLAVDDSWCQVNACGALAKMGTPRAVAALTRLAKDNRYPGVLNVKRMAQEALEAIAKREKRDTEEQLGGTP